jgi:hypothetical protein
MDIMNPALLWLASDLSNEASGNRYVAKFWDASLPPGEAAERCLEAPALRRTT